MLKKLINKSYFVLILLIPIFVISSCDLFKLNGIELEKITIDFNCNTNSNLIGKKIKIIHKTPQHMGNDIEVDHVIHNNYNNVTIEHFKYIMFDFYDETTNLNTLIFLVYIMENNQGADDVEPSEFSLNVSKTTKKTNNLVYKESKILNYLESENLKLDFTVFYGYGGWY